jgi:hypothetical protein
VSVLMASLSVELLKLKRTLALRMSFVAPAVVVALQVLFFFWQADRMPKTPDFWPLFTSSVAGLWAVLMLPLYITLEASLLAQLEHSNKHWKDLLVLPAPRWMFFVSKFLVLGAMVALSTGVVYLLCIGGGTLLHVIRPRLHFGPTPWGAAGLVHLKLLSATLLMITIQHWISLRWRNFTVAVSSGMLAVVIGLIVVNSEYGDYYPWAMPAHAIGLNPSRYKTILFTSLIVGAFALLAGAWDFARQELG